MKTLIRTIATAALGLFASTAAKAEVPLPTNYMQLEYIESSAGAVIDTEIAATYDLSAILDCVPLENEGNGSFGVAYDDKADWRFAPYGNGCFFDCGNKRAGNTNKGTVLHPGTRYTVKVGLDGDVIYNEVFNADGTAYGARQTVVLALSDKPRSVNVYLFGVNNESKGIAYSKLRLYSFKLFKAGGLVRDFVPCRNTTGEFGLWDLVEGKFYGKHDGPGEFEGPERIPYAKFDGDGYAYFGANGQPMDPPATGISGLPLAFATSDEYQALLDAPERVAQAAGVILEKDIALTADADWSLLDVYIGPNKVDLNGHTLTVNRLNRNCEITDTSAADQGGELHVNVAAGKVIASGTMTVTGSAKFFKDGAGTLQWDGGANSVAATVPVSVTAGLLKFNTDDTDVFGTSGDIYIADDAQMDIARKSGANPSTVYNRTFHIAGDGPDGRGAICQGVDCTPGNHLKTVYLTGDATIGVAARLDFRGDDILISGEGFTLTVKNLGSKQCNMDLEPNNSATVTLKRFVATSNTLLQLSGGAKVLKSFTIPEGIELQNCTVSPFSGQDLYTIPVPFTVSEGTCTIMGSSPLSITGKMTVRGGGTLNCTLGRAIAFADVELQEGATLAGSSAMTVAGTLRGNGAITAANLTFGAGSSWHVECNDAGLTEKANLDGASAACIASIKKIDVLSDGIAETQTCDLAPTKGLATVENIVLTVIDATSKMPLGASTLAIEDGKIVLTVDRRDPRPVVAVWTGAAGNGDLADPGNWACTNAAGKAVAELPCEVTDVYLNGEIAFQFPAGTTFAAKSITANIALTAACDWSGLTMPLAGRIDLGGHDLTVTQFNGDCEITDTSAADQGGELHVNVAANTTAPSGLLKVTGSVKFFKDGEGTLRWDGGANSVAATVPVSVTAGLLKFNTDDNDVFGTSGDIYIADDAQMDIAKKSVNANASPVFNRTFHIEGDGPDGRGAICQGVNASAGNQLKTVYLTGDATIGVAARLDFRSENILISGEGFTLTVKNLGSSRCILDLESSSSTTVTLKRLVAMNNALLQLSGGVNVQQSFDIPEGIELLNSTVSPYILDNSTYTIPVPFTVGEGGGTILGGSNLSITGKTTVRDGGTLNCTLSKPITFTDVELESGATLAGSSAMTVTGTLSGSGAITAQNLTFGAGSSWHVECNDEAITEKADLSGASEACITSIKKIDVLSDGVAETQTYGLVPAKGLDSVENIVLTVIDATSKMPLGASTLALEDGEIVLHVDRRDPRAVVAVWTGAAGNGDLADPGNWACTNAAGAKVSGDYGVPCEITDVHLSGEIALQIPADTTFTAKSITANIALTDTCDWSGLTAPVGGRINLNGSDLIVSQMNGGCTVTDTREADQGGELHVNVAADEVISSGAMKVTGSVKFFKDGAGTLQWDGGANSLSTTISVSVTDGLLKFNTNDDDVFGAGGDIYIFGKGQMDISKKSVANASPVFNRTFHIEGDGPDGRGAICQGVNGAPGNHLKTVYLTGDATIGVASRLDFRSENILISGEGFTLTIKNLGTKQCNLDLDPGKSATVMLKRIVATNNALIQLSGGTNIQQTFDIPEGIELLNSSVSPYIPDKSTYTLAVPLTFGEGGGTVLGGTGAFVVTGKVTVRNGSTANFTLTTPITFTDVELEEGATLAGSSAMTITGTLSGSGAVTAPNLAFAGDDSCWQVKCNDTGVTEGANLEKASPNFLTALRKIEVLYDKIGGIYDLAPIGNLQVGPMSQIVLVVKNASTGHVQKKSVLVNRNGRLCVYVPTSLKILVH